MEHPKFTINSAITEGCFVVAEFLLTSMSCVCLATLLVLAHLKTTPVLYEQPSAGCLWTGNAHLVDQDEPGFERLSSTFSSIISESTPPGSVRRTVPSGTNSWRRLCPVKDAPPDDDDDDDCRISTDKRVARPSAIAEFLVFIW